MKYTSVKVARFIRRPNRFIAHVMVDNKEEIVHVKNTGRCREILKKGTVVILEEAKNTERKTKYSLIACYKGNVLINIIKWVCHLQPIDANNSIKFVA